MILELLQKGRVAALRARGAIDPDVAFVKVCARDAWRAIQRTIAADLLDEYRDLVGSATDTIAELQVKLDAKGRELSGAQWTVEHMRGQLSAANEEARTTSVREDTLANLLREARRALRESEESRQEAMLLIRELRQRAPQGDSVVSENADGTITVTAPLGATVTAAAITLNQPEGAL